MAFAAKGRALRLAGALVAVLAIAACAKNPAEDGGLAGAGEYAAPGSPQDFVVNVGDRVFFETDSVELTPTAQATLDKQARWLQQYNRYSFTIEGHADERGTREYNFALGSQRAEATKNYLAARGISPARMHDCQLWQGAAGRRLQRHFLLVAESPRGHRAERRPILSSLNLGNAKSRGFRGFFFARGSNQTLAELGAQNICDNSGRDRFMLPRFTRSLMLSGALLFPAFAANAEPASSPGIELAQYPYYGQRPPAEVDDYGTPGGRQDEAGLSVRVDHLESQLRSLTGQLEQAQFQVRKLQEQLTTFQQDIEFRFQEAPHGPASRSGVQRRSEFEPAPGTIPHAQAAGVTPGTSGSLATAGMRRGDAFDPANAPNAPGVPRQLGSISSTAVATTPSITHEARAEVPTDQGFEETRDPRQPMNLMHRGGASAASPPSGPLVPITESPAGRSAHA